MKKARMSINELISSGDGSRIWPYIVTKRCKGKTFAELRETLSWDDTLYLASFLGEQLRNLHLLPFPSLNASTLADAEEKMEYPCVSGSMEAVTNKLSIPAEWDFFIRTLTRRKKDVCSRLTKCHLRSMDTDADTNTDMGHGDFRKMRIQTWWEYGNIIIYF
ncbi:F-box protein At1g78280-like isoform X1 [Camellia sinensis]|uniref:F-box protein At1g78280-like isoform X1 n=1 Tax=Camellia sinensis TaxID=4442 RepID=UPI00103659A1|nr:F-box protein At1g78280-like isoform X1 [Camellia sinensis]